ncbi:MAG: polyribonucleotide nucleotidyltransferase [Candidatus Omnitrophica bacterium]|nr:polyribonucleotide nucleotidyltransferase [Candidatus Omnitrophota bacterium]
MQEISVKKKFGSEDFIVSTGKFAKQADGSVTVQYGGTVVLVTACISKEIKSDINFFPLTVEYQEKTYAAGRIPGGFFKREGRPSENEILTARLIDRPIRPLFPKDLFNEVQIMSIVLSSDGQNDPDVLAVNGASAALSISKIPFNGPLAACRVGRLNNEFILNPTYSVLEKSDLDVVIAGTKQGIIMLESKANEVSEEIFKQAVEFGYRHLQDLIELQQQLQEKYSEPKLNIEAKLLAPELMERVKQEAEKRLEEVCKLTDKESREEALEILFKEINEKLTAEGFLTADIQTALVELERKEVRDNILEKGIRVDGRGIRDIRPISCEIAVLPRTHGSGLFVRGQTQSLAVTTLGTGEDRQLIEALEGETYKTFMLHYSFPPFSVGEIAPVRGPGRREIGHGALAEKALLAVMPAKEEFPYTIRVVSEILESNGSSSMATVCAATLSLMDAGVPIKKPVAGIALGLVKEDSRYIILTDICGLEDHFGDMDFKVAGTEDGITTVQLDVKLKEGIDIEILKRSLEQAKEARLIVLEKMEKVIARPRPEISSFAPRIQVIKVEPDKIGELIGPGGKTIKKIISATGVTIDIQEDGNVLVASTDAKAQAKAMEMIKAIVEEISVGTIYTGIIKRIVNFGAFCELAGGKEGLIHISELADHFVKNVEDIVKVGDEVRVKVIGIDDLGRINLSLKQAQNS